MLKALLSLFIILTALFSLSGVTSALIERCCGDESTLSALAGPAGLESAPCEGCPSDGNHPCEACPVCHGQFAPLTEQSGACTSLPVQTAVYGHLHLIAPKAVFLRGLYRPPIA